LRWDCSKLLGEQKSWPSGAAVVHVVWGASPLGLLGCAIVKLLP
jgi:hypothetical protein